MKKLLDLILFIDDDEGTNFLHKRFTAKSGCTKQIKTVTSASKAISYLKNNNSSEYIRPNIIFLDVNMPEMSGWDFLEEYNKLSDKSHSDIVLVMLSSSLSPSDKKKADEFKIVDDFKNKPLTSNSLLSLVKEKFPERF